MISMKRLMQAWLFILVLLCQQGDAALAQQQSAPQRKKIGWTHGMGAEPKKFEWCQTSKCVKILGATAEKANCDIELFKWLDESNQGDIFAGLLPMDRLKGAVKIAHGILDFSAQHPNTKIILFGYSFGGQVMNGATNLLKEGNLGLASERSLSEELAILIITVVDIGLDFIPALSRTRIILQKYWGLIEKIAAKVDKNSSRTNQMQYVLEVLKKELTLEYLGELENAWINAYKQVQDRKQSLMGNRPVPIELIYSVGTPFGDLPIFNLTDPNILRIHFYSEDDNIAALAGHRALTLDKNVANICVYLEGDGSCCCCGSSAPIPTISRPGASYGKNYAPGHLTIVGNELMAPWFWRMPDCFMVPGKDGVPIPYEKDMPFFGRNMSAIFSLATEQEPILLYNEGNLPKGQNYFHFLN